MNYYKNFLQEKKYGYWVSVGLTILTLIAAIVYLATYKSDTRDYSSAITIVLFVGFAIEAIMLATKLDKAVPYVLLIVGMAAFCLWAYSIYWYVSEVFVGIDEHEFSAKFIINTIILLVLLIGGIVDCFLPQVKGKNNETNKEGKVTLNEN